MAATNWRTINIDLYDPDSPANFPVTSLLPSSIPSISASEVQSLAGQVKQLLRGGDTEGALRGALENVPYGGDSAAKVSLLSEAQERAVGAEGEDQGIGQKAEVDFVVLRD